MKRIARCFGWLIMPIQWRIRGYSDWEATKIAWIHGASELVYGRPWTFADKPKPVKVKVVQDWADL